MEYALFKLSVPDEWKDIMVAELGELGFDMMEETKDGIEAVVEKSKKDQIEVNDLLGRYDNVTALHGEWKEVENINWNEEWEKNYDPVKVLNKCYIRAEFHQADPSFEYEILITPRMSFGTGHHATTWLMVAAMLEYPIEGNSVLDAGCGTGVLAILAQKMSAGTVEAYDVSQLCVDNTLDNATANDVDFPVFCGTVADIEKGKEYDYILANINKNALLEEIPSFSKCLKNEGIIFLSGFFVEDIEDISEKAKANNLELVHQDSRNKWAVLGFKSI